MAQIDREEGNQSALGEAFNSHNHSHTFEKKEILDLFTLSNNHANVQGEGGQIEGGHTERYNKEELEHGVGRDFPKSSHSLF